MKRAELKQIFRFALDADRQVEEGRLLLTLLDVEQVSGEGAVDFTGEAFQEARRIKRPAKRPSS